jgi:hypothetical protein
LDELGTSRIRSEYEDSHFERLSELARERRGVGAGLGDDGVQRQRKRYCLGRGDLAVRRCFLTGFRVVRGVASLSPQILSEDQTLSLSASLTDMGAAGKAHTVLDVGEARELDICRLEGALHVPMAEIPARSDDLPTKKPLVVRVDQDERPQRR